ncbi:MAG: D-alanine--D-alanine ligase [Defluviitaleaceae bacterium]|nr:D-alanine--D-alanine ligase [Defluviitaleaceae bacterium]
MTKLNVAVVFGGYSSEHEVSINSAINIINSLSKEKYNIIPIYINPMGSWFLHEGSTDSIKTADFEKFGTPCQLSLDRQNKGLLRINGDKVKRIPVDVAFPVLHGKFGEDGTIQGLFEMSGIKYVGCGVMASAIAMDKAMAKLVAGSLGINQVKYIVFDSNDLEDFDKALSIVRYKLGYPCFVKPLRTGSSVGISKVKNKKELVKAVELAISHDDSVIIEKMVEGRELECAVLGTGGEDTIVSGVGELIPGAEFYDFDAKYNNPDSKTILSPKIDKAVVNKIKDASLKIFKAIGAKGLSRVDFFLEESSGDVIFNELNTIPGFTDISMYPMLMREAGIDSQRLMDRLIEIAIQE